MFAQANSEHCRHKIFNAEWIVDGERQPKSLFAMIRNTYARNSRGVLSAYRDNAAVIEGWPGARLFPAGDRATPTATSQEPIDILMKVETHNHPTAIAPFPGAATGSGGEIRDEGATGCGAKPKAGLTGFTVSNLRIPDAVNAWETQRELSPRIASALQIMIDGPIGAAAFNNEFGRPNILGYFRSFELALARGCARSHSRLPQADHDRGRSRQHPACARRETWRYRSARASSCSAVPGCSLVSAVALPHRSPAARARRISTSLPCSVATRRSSGARRKSSIAAGRSASAIQFF